MKSISYGAGGLLAVAVFGSGVASAGVGMAYLKTGPGAFGASQAQAVVARVEGGEACLWNPAGLAGTPRFHVDISHVETFADLRYEYAALSLPLGAAHVPGLPGTSRFVVAVSFDGIWTDNIPGYDDRGNRIESFGYSAYDARLSMGISLPRGGRLGFGLGTLNETIGSYVASGWSASAGLQWDLARVGLGVPLGAGLSVRNLGPSVSFLEEEIDLPRIVQFGLNWERAAGGGAVEMEADVSHTLGEGYALRFGCEYVYRGTLGLGAGYRTGHQTRGVSLGVAFHTGPLALRWSYSPVGEDLGSEHRFSLGADL